MRRISVLLIVFLITISLSYGVTGVGNNLFSTGGTTDDKYFEVGSEGDVDCSSVTIVGTFTQTGAQTITGNVDITGKITADNAVITNSTITVSKVTTGIITTAQVTNATITNSTTTVGVITTGIIATAEVTNATIGTIATGTTLSVGTDLTVLEASYFGGVATRSTHTTTGNLMLHGDLTVKGDDIQFSDTNLVIDVDATNSVRISSNVVVEGFVQIYSRTEAQLKTLFPTGVGQLYWDSDNSQLLISTGTGIGAFGLVADGAFPASW